MPESEALAKVRSAIANNPAAWKQASDDKRFRQAFGGIGGEALSRPPRGFDPDHPFIEDIKRKSFFAMHDGGLKLAQSADLADEVAQTFRSASPLMRFLCTALDVPY